MREHIRLLRPYQYVKNAFIFLPAFFALRIFEPVLLFETTLVAIAFSFLASSVYILNDWMDVEEDRQHPRKKNRPLAAGTVKPRTAFVMMGILLAVGVSILAWVNLNVLYLALGYLGMNLLYSIRLKHIPILDLFVIAAGFVIRLLLGSWTGDVPLTNWIIMMTFLLAVFLGLAKRRDDVLLSDQGSKVRKAIDGYNLEFVNSAMTIMASVMIVAYILYMVSPEIQAKFDSEYLYVTSAFVVIGVLRYLQITFVEKKSGNPSRVLLKDVFLQLTLVGWIVAFLVLIY